MQTSVHWLENVAFEAKSESGHSVLNMGVKTVVHVLWS